MVLYNISFIPSFDLLTTQKYSFTTSTHTHTHTHTLNSWIEDYIQPAIEKNEVENFEETLRRTRAQVEKDSKDKRKDEDPDETETESEDDDANNVKVSKQSGGRRGKTVPRKAKSTKIKAKSKQKNSEQDLIAAIRNKNGRGNPLASIAARYGVSSVDDDPLDDAHFEQLRSKYSIKKK